MSNSLLTRENLRRSYDNLSDQRLAKLARMLEPRQPCGGYWTAKPWPKQAAFLSYTGREALFGGSAGPGKSWAMILAAIQYACVPGYAAVLLRRTFPQLAGDGGLMEKSHDILDSTDARFSVSEKRWHFPSNATLAFGHLAYEQDKLNFQSLEYQFVGFDELTQWPTDNAYRYVGFSRVRGPAEDSALKACPHCGLTLADVPFRTRAGTNPGGPGADWVYRRFVEPWEQWRDGLLLPNPDRKFIPARLPDNPSLNQEAYEASLAELSVVDREQLLNGDWSVRAEGGMFKRHQITIVDDFPMNARYCRYWDLAATEPTSENPDPDFTVGALLALNDGHWTIVDVRRDRLNPGGVEQLIKQTAMLDRDRYGNIAIRMEQEPGASGKTTVAYFKNRVLVGYDFDGHSPGKDKPTRAKPLSAAASNGNLSMMSDRGTGWNSDLLDEFEVFPGGGHDDCVDACTGAMFSLANDFVEKKRVRVIV